MRQDAELITAVKSFIPVILHEALKRARLRPQQVRTARRRLPLLSFVFLDDSTDDNVVLACVEVLVSYGADVNYKFEDAVTLVTAGRERGGDASQSLRTVLSEAIRRDSPALLNGLFKKCKADFNLPQCGRHVLALAISSGLFRVALWLVTTLGVLNVDLVHQCYESNTDDTLKRFVDGPPPQCAVLQNVIVEHC